MLQKTHLILLHMFKSDSLHEILILMATENALQLNHEKGRKIKLTDNRNKWENVIFYSWEGDCNGNKLKEDN